MNNDPMKSFVKLFLVLLTVTVFMFSWLTGQLSEPRRIILLSILSGLTILVFFILNLMDNREQKRKRTERESGIPTKGLKNQKQGKRSGTSFAVKERKSGLTWGGGNIKASEAKRGTKRKFLGK